MMEITTTAAMVVALKFMAAFPGVASIALANHLHPQSGIDCQLSGDDFNMSTACWMALEQLDVHGVDQIRICEVTRIEAPLSGYLVDAEGIMELDGNIYTLFRSGIRDGEENPSWAGEEFVFLAAGFNESGESFIYPRGTNIEDPDGGFTWEHEFLYNEEYFLSIPERYL